MDKKELNSASDLIGSEIPVKSQSEKGSKINSDVTESEQKSDSLMNKKTNSNAQNTQNNDPMV